MRELKPLYRKVNTKARGHHHHTGPDAKHTRGTKKGMTSKMKQGKQRELDYTPLYRFLLSKIGQPFDQVYSEAIKRIPEAEPISYLVKEDNTGQGYTYCGESSMYSTMYVDDQGLLQLVKPELVNTDFKPTCWCCTHTFNGKPLTRKWSYESIIGTENGGE